MQCPCSGCRAPSIVLECGFSGHAVDTVSHKVDAVCYDGSCTSHEGGCIAPAVLAVPPVSYGKVDAVHMQWMQCPTRWMQYVVTEDGVPTKVDAVRLHC